MDNQVMGAENLKNIMRRYMTMRRRSNITKCSHTNIIKMKEELKGANVNQQQAEEQDSCFLRLAEPQLVQMFIGDGTKLVRDA